MAARTRRADLSLPSEAGGERQPRAHPPHASPRVTAPRLVCRAHIEVCLMASMVARGPCLGERRSARRAHREALLGGHMWGGAAAACLFTTLERWRLLQHGVML